MPLQMKCELFSTLFFIFSVLCVSASVAVFHRSVCYSNLFLTWSLHFFLSFQFRLAFWFSFGMSSRPNVVGNARFAYFSFIVRRVYGVCVWLQPNPPNRIFITGYKSRIVHRVEYLSHQ